MEETRLQAKAKDTKKSEAKAGQPFQGQTLSRPRTGMLEAKVKDQGRKRKCSPKKKVLKLFFCDLQKKVLKNFFQVISDKKVIKRIF